MLSDKIANTEYKHIWEILNALMEQDSDLADVVNKVYGKLGGGIHTEGGALDKFMHINANVDLQDLIKVKMLERFGKSWNHNYMYEQLKIYKKEHNNTFDGLRKHLRLYKYVQYIRSAYLKGFDMHIAERLIDLGLKINKPTQDLDYQWNRMFEQLVAYKKKFNDTHVKRYGEYKSLGKWVACQRETYKEGGLKADRLDKLLSIGFAFNYLEQQWHDNYKAYKEALEKDEKLGEVLTAWASFQRKAFKNGKLAPERVRLLQQINFNFDIKKPTYFSRQETRSLESESFAKLQEYYKEHGNIDVPSNDQYQYVAKWLYRQRVRYEQGIIDPLIKATLDKMGMKWKKSEAVNTTRWKNQVWELKKYIANKIPLPPHMHNFYQKLLNRKLKASFTPIQQQYLEEIEFWKISKRA